MGVIADAVLQANRLNYLRGRESRDRGERSADAWVDAHKWTMNNFQRQAALEAEQSLRERRFDATQDAWEKAREDKRASAAAILGSYEGEDPLWNRISDVSGEDRERARVRERLNDVLARRDARREAELHGARLRKEGLLGDKYLAETLTPEEKVAQAGKLAQAETGAKLLAEREEILARMNPVERLLSKVTGIRGGLRGGGGKASPGEEKKRTIQTIARFLEERGLSPEQALRHGLAAAGAGSVRDEHIDIAKALFTTMVNEYSGKEPLSSERLGDFFRRALSEARAISGAKPAPKPKGGERAGAVSGLRSFLQGIGVLGGAGKPETRAAPSAPMTAPAAPVAPAAAPDQLAGVLEQLRASPAGEPASFLSREQADELIKRAMETKDIELLRMLRERGVL